MNRALATFILARQCGFIREADMPKLIELDRLCWLLVRCGAQHGRFSAPAQNIPQLIATIEAAGDWVRDVSFPTFVIDEARAWLAAHPEDRPANQKLVTAWAISKRAHLAREHNIDRYPNQEPPPRNIEGEDWICTGNFDGSTCGSDADSGL